MMLSAMIAAMGMPAMAGAVDLDNYLRRESFTDIKISPGGEYYATTVPFEKSSALAILRVDDGQLVGTSIRRKATMPRRSIG